MKMWYVRLINEATNDKCGVLFKFEYRADAADFLLKCMENSASCLNHFEIYQDEEVDEDV